MAHKYPPKSNKSFTEYNKKNFHNRKLRIIIMKNYFQPEKVN